MRVVHSIVTVVVAGAVLQGCASIPAQQSAGAEALYKARSAVAGAAATIDSPNAADEAARILAAPLQADDAVRLALLQSPDMRALYAQLGFAYAEVYEASRLSNPSLGYVRSTGDGGTVKTTWGLSQSFVELLFLGHRTRIGRSQVLQTQQSVAAAVLELEAQVRTAYYNYVCADLIAQMREQVSSLAAASAQYAQQLRDAGNIDALQLAREMAAAAEARVVARSSVVDARAAEVELLNLFGIALGGKQQPPQFVVQLQLPGQINTDQKLLHEFGLEQRLDLSALREQLRMQEANLRHARRWRWLGGVQALGEREKHDGDVLEGFGAEVELPIFNQGRGNLLRAEADFKTTQASLAKMETAIANDIYLRYAAVQVAAQNADEFRKHLVPLHEQIVSLSQKNQNFMLIGAFELMTEKRTELDTYQAYLEAVRDYWLAHTELRRALGGSLPQGLEGEAVRETIDINAVVPGLQSTEPQQ